MYYNNEIYGISFSGIPLNPNVSGSLDTGLYPNGYGEVYGIYWNSGINQSFGLAKHTIDNLIAPVESGDIFWPAPIPFGNKIEFGFNKITYYDTGRQIALYDESGLISGNNQAILDIDISTLFSPLVGINNQQIGTTTGYFLTTGRYNNYGNFGGNINAFFSGFNLSNPKFTGFIAYRSGKGMQEFDGGGDFQNYLNSGILKIGIEKSDFFLKPFYPILIKDEIPATDTDYVTGWRVNGFFSSFKDRLGDISKEILLNQPSSQYCIFFSGYDGNKPLYLTYVSGSSVINIPIGFASETIDVVYTSEDGIFVFVPEA